MSNKVIPGLVCVLLIGGAAFAQPPPPLGGGAAHQLDRMAILLDLSDAQKQQLQQLLQQEHAKMRSLREQSQASGQRPDWQQLRATHEQLRQELLNQAQGFLSADQLKKLQVLLEAPPPGPHGHRGPPPPDAP